LGEGGDPQLPPFTVSENLSVLPRVFVVPPVRDDEDSRQNAEVFGGGERRQLWIGRFPEAVARRRSILEDGPPVRAGRRFVARVQQVTDAEQVEQRAIHDREGRRRRVGNRAVQGTKGLASVAEKGQVLAIVQDIECAVAPY